MFGLLLVALSLFVALETVSRKLFNHSFQGADELGGYVLAIGGALSFSVALIERGHIRIDLVHDLLGKKAQAVLNWLSSVLLAVMGLFLARYCFMVVQDTVAYGSTAPTAWATPMIYPQGIWYGAMVVFTGLSLWMAIVATRLLLSGDIDTLNKEFHTKSAMEELEEELEDLQRR
jgi:TRAP-type C4-dicarboxylate transport system permease small subunit